MSGKHTGKTYLEKSNAYIAYSLDTGLIGYQCPNASPVKSQKMEQIQKHEWKRDNKSEWRCTHCTAFKVKHRSGQISYFIKGKGFIFIEPACITRNTGKEAEQNGTTN